MSKSCPWILDPSEYIQRLACYGRIFCVLPSLSAKDLCEMQTIRKKATLLASNKRPPSPASAAAAIATTAADATAVESAAGSTRPPLEPTQVATPPGHRQYHSRVAFGGCLGMADQGGVDDGVISR
ncbi:hypothetical protein VOLCADRAFT_94128 [Volvox carteri f. nagariensis]|uniref:Uncharacterized protein n=1 Tax=Volvox carteri f. nagariensis TaxID=3068 RepID=D8U3Z4_VOLCA|nr:uncharacterized protein VOLCADRAFT_94128 [Volvox carteri f. nagariensis]EFJ45617.1 hypothetical protein VOLCADRAFT_94128 [Volvox carteri f. nagariensis]|eukprot:XP_002953307.1 hypothetical protein VOLCADRAFT_94128 [Volvox carteri f. nagariensis]